MDKRMCHEKIDAFFGDIFARFGRLISRHPVKVIIAVVLLNGLLGIGMLNMKKDIDVSRVYTPANSQASMDEQKILNLFPDKSGHDYYGYQLSIQRQEATVYVKPRSGNILNSVFLSELQKVVDTVKAVEAKPKENDSSLNFESLCARNKGQCVIDGAVFLSNDFINSFLSNNVGYPAFRYPSGFSVNLESLLGGVEYSDSKLIKATHLKLQFNLRPDSLEWVEKASEWQEKFVEAMESFSNPEFEIAYGHSKALQTELDKNIGGDIALFSVTFVLMISYACCATISASNNCIGNRLILGYCGVISAGLGIVASLGLVSACGMSFVSIVGNMPFLILGIGVDDMFILLSGLILAGFKDGISTRIGNMMRISGVAITITSLTNVLAFSCGAASTFKSVRNFCVYTGVAVIFCYINQMTLFTACLSLNERRVDAKRHAVFCCTTVKTSDEYKSENASGAKIFCCGGRTPTRRRDVDSWFERLPSRILPKMVLHTAGKVIILLCTLVYLAVGIWGAVNLQQGLVRKDLLSDESYYYKFITWKENYFKSRLPVAFVVDTQVPYHSTDIQNTVSDMIVRASNDTFMSNIHISWLEAYTTSPYYVNSSESAFISNLMNNFFADPRYSRFNNDVKISPDNNSIVASRVYVFTENIEKSQDSGQMMLNMRDVAANTDGLSVTAFAPSFIFYEQYVAILPQTLQTLGTSLVAVFIITAVFMPHPLLLLYIVVTMAMIIVGIIGFMHHWGLTLSSITMIHIIMSVGFSVDYTAHTCHAFMVANGRDRNERVRKALKASGSPIFNGAVSSIIGILMLAVAKSYIFQSFFKVMLLVVVFGIAHSVLFLPVILSVIGPGKTMQDDKKDDNDDDDDFNAGDEMVEPEPEAQRMIENGGNSPPRPREMVSTITESVIGPDKKDDDDNAEDKMVEPEPEAQAMVENGKKSPPRPREMVSKITESGKGEESNL